MSTISYSTFRSQLRRWGVTFVEHSRYDRCLKRTVPWYQHEARRYSDCARRGWDAHGIAIHHTGGPTAWSFVWDGRLSERIPGPLYIAEIYEDGVAHLTGWGVSNNVGACDKTVRDRVLAGRMPTSGGNVSPGADDFYAANSEFYGIAYRGTAPNTAQRRTALRMCAAICEAHGSAWDGGSIAGHKELTRRKPDPEGENMSTFRADVNHALANPPTSTGGGSGGVTIPDPTVPGGFDPEEDPLPSVEEVWTGYTVVGGPQAGDTPITALAEAATFALDARNRAAEILANQAKQLAELAAIRAAVGGDPVDEGNLAHQLAPLLAPLLVAAVVAELGDEAGVTAEQVEAAQERVLRRVLGELAEA